MQAILGAPDTPPFACTSGLLLRDRPGLIVFGLPPRVAMAILDDLGARMRDGATDADGQGFHDVVDGQTVLLLDVIDSSEQLLVANALA